MSYGDDDEVNPFSREHISRRHEPLGESPPLQDIPSEGVSPTRSPPTGNPLVKWAVGCLVALVGFGVVCCGGLLFYGFSQMKVPVAAATAAINADDRITDKLGTPVESTSTRKVEILRQGNGGTADVEFNVKGPNGVAEVSGKMKYFADEWVPDGMTVTCADGTEFKLPANMDVDDGQEH